MAHTRRTFLKSAGLATAAVSAAPLALGLPGGPGGGPAIAAAAPGGRGYAAGRFALELDGAAAGLLQAFEGGNAYADVIEFRNGGDASPFAHKSPGPVQYEEITVLVGFGMAAPFWDWLGHMMDGDAQKKTGAVVVADFNYNVIRRMEFHGALITEVGFPALDGASKDPAYLTVKFRPEMTELKAAGGKLTNPANAKQKLWLTSNFRVQVGDLPCKRVAKIDAFSIKQQVQEFRNGGDDVSTVHLVPGDMDVSDLALTFSAQDSQQWQDFFDNFVLVGKNDDGDELEGTLDYLAPDLKAVLGTVQFHNVGIFKLAPEEVDPTGETLARFKAEMYVERNRLFVGGLN